MICIIPFLIGLINSIKISSISLKFVSWILQFTPFPQLKFYLPEIAFKGVKSTGISFVELLHIPVRHFEI